MQFLAGEKDCYCFVDSAHSPPQQIRKTTASHMYEMLLIYDDIAEPDVLENVMSVLSDTNWSVKFLRRAELRRQINR